jgi:hypothetical protein
MPARKTDKTPKPAGRTPVKRAAARGKAATTLPESMVTGKAPREGCGRRQAGFRLHRQSAAAAAQHRGTC